MDPVEVGFRGDPAQLNRTLQSIEGSLQGFASTSKKLIGGAFALFSVSQVASWGKSFIDAAAEGQAAGAKFEAALAANGNAAGVTAEEINQLATDLQKVTKFEGDATVAGAAMLASFKNVKGNVFKDAIVSSQDLATAMGTDLEGAMFKVGKALDNPIKGLGALRGAGVRFSEDQVTVIKQLQETGDLAGAQAIILDELKAKFGGAAEAAGETFAGRVESLKNRLGDLAETIGGWLISAIDLLIPTIQTAVEFWEEFAASVGDNTTQVGAFVEGALGYLIDGFKMLLTVGVAVFTGIQVVIENWRDAAELAFKSVMLAGVVWFETQRHFYGTVLPGLLTYFIENWREIFTDAYNFVTTVFSNMYTNIKDFFTAVYDWLSGGEADFKWTGLTEGFESSLKELPKIAEREIGPLEKGLRDRIGELGGSMADKFQSKFKENMEAVGLGDTTITAPTVGANAAAAPRAGRDFASEAAKIRDEEEKKKQAEKDAKKEEKGTSEKSASPFEGLTQLYDRIRNAAASNPLEDATKKTAEQTERTARAAEKTAAASERTAKALESSPNQANPGQAPVGVWGP